MNRLLPVLCLSLLVSPSTLLRADDSDKLAFFEERIRPVLIEHCYACHNSHGTAEGELALDHRQAMLKGGVSGSLMAADVSKSLLLKVLRHQIDGLQMPQDGPKLEPRVIADFEHWLASGATDPRTSPPTAQELAQATSWETLRSQRMQWWSFQPLVSPLIPKLDDDLDGTSTELSAIDRFLRAGQRQVDLRPNPPADRETLVRRIYFALLGLPPTPAQIKAFVDDPRSDAFEQLVDALLQSQRFGEHWGRHWLDWLRYAESHGSEGDPRIAGAHHYRDYIIRALNADVPYDQLVREHVAGDLLEQPRINRQLGVNESVIGTAHWRMVFHGFAPTDALDEKVRFTDDALDTFSKAFLGLTVSCARCHDHKFDAISQADYYALFGILASTRPGRTAIELPEQLSSKDAELEELKLQLRQALAADWLQALPGLGERMLHADRLQKAEQDKSHLLYPLVQVKQAEAEGQASSAAIATKWKSFLQAFDQDRIRQAEVFDPGDGPDWDLSTDEDYDQWFRYGNGLSGNRSLPGQFAIEAAGPAVVTGVYPAGVYTHLLSEKQAGRLTSTEFTAQANQRLWLQIVGGGSAMSRYVVENYPRNGTVYPVKEIQEKSHGWQWQDYDLSYWQGDKLHVELTTALDAPLLVKEQPRSWFGVRKVLVSAADSVPPQATYCEGLAPLIESFTVSEQIPRSATDVSAALVHVLRTALQKWRDNQVGDAEALLIDACLSHDLLPNTLESLPTAGPIVVEYRRLEEQVPVATRVPTLDEWQGADSPLFERGNHLQPRQKVARRFLQAIDGSPYQTGDSGRRQLAEDLLREDNPFTCRVIVNRIWLHLFGQGIVSTPDNFGRLGAPPTHPELLDHLASEFRKTDRWSIKRMIRRVVTSHAWQQASTPSAAARERDPENQYYTHFAMQRLNAEAIRDSILVVSSQMDWGMYGAAVEGQVPRRSIYVRVLRNNLDPFLSAFNAPTPFSCQGQREVTNVPAQSLLLLNGELAQRAARHLAQRIYCQPDLADDRARIGQLWRVALGRDPSLAEMRAAARFLQTDESAATKRGSESPDSQADRGAEQVMPVDVPAEWIELAHAIINLKEFIYVR